eukprot:1010639-Prymnesium_polylepis.1
MGRSTPRDGAPPGCRCRCPPVAGQAPSRTTAGRRSSRPPPPQWPSASAAARRWSCTRRRSSRCARAA